MEGVLQYLEAVTPQHLSNHPDIFADGTSTQPTCYVLQNHHAMAPPAIRGGLRQRAGRGRRCGPESSVNNTLVHNGTLSSVHNFRVSLSGEATVVSKRRSVIARRYDVASTCLVVESFECTTEHAPTIFRIVAVSGSAAPSALLGRYGQYLTATGAAEETESPATLASRAATLCSNLFTSSIPLLASGTEGLQLGVETDEWSPSLAHSSGGLTASDRRSLYNSNPSMAEADDGVVVRELNFSENPISPLRTTNRRQHQDPASDLRSSIEHQPPVSAFHQIFLDLESAEVASSTAVPDHTTGAEGRAFSSYCVSNERSLDRYNGTSSNFVNKAYWFQLAFDDMVERNSIYYQNYENGWKNWSVGPLKSMERPVIVNSMDEVAAFLHISPAAFFAGVAILDHYLASVAEPDADNVRPNNFRCLVIACPFIASKLLDFRSPTMTRVIESLGLQVDPSVICGAEVAILTSLEFMVHPLTAHDAIDFLQHLPIVVGGKEGGMYCHQALHASIATTSAFLLDCAVRGYIVLRYTAFEVAYAAYTLSCQTAGVTTHPHLRVLLSRVHKGISIVDDHQSEIRERECMHTLRLMLSGYGLGGGNDTPAELPRIVRERHAPELLHQLHSYLIHTSCAN